MSNRRPTGRDRDHLGTLIQAVLHGTEPPPGYGHFQPHDVRHPAQTVNGRSPSSPDAAGRPHHPHRSHYPVVYGLAVAVAVGVTVLALLFA